MGQNVKKSPLEFWKEAMNAMVDLSGGRADWEETAESRRDDGPEPQLSEEVTRICRDVILEGDLSSPGDVIFQGEIKGNLSAAGRLVVQGRVEGGLSGETVQLTGAVVEGEVTAEGELVVDGDTVVLGDLHCRDCTVWGKVKGNIYAHGWTTLKSGCCLLGEISSGGFTMDEGARLSGLVRLHTQHPEEDFSAISGVS